MYDVRGNLPALQEAAKRDLEIKVGRYYLFVGCDNFETFWAPDLNAWKDRKHRKCLEQTETCQRGNKYIFENVPTPWPHTGRWYCTGGETEYHKRHYGMFIETTAEGIPIIRDANDVPFTIDGRPLTEDHPIDPREILNKILSNL